jgi:proton-dependent oligopeptide transporter, POT family
MLKRLFRNKVPSSVFIIFFVSIVLMIGAATYQGLLTLYMTKLLGFTDGEAYSLYAAFAGIQYAFSLFGGYIGDRFISKRSAVLSGLLLMALGLYFVSLGGLGSLLWGLSVYILGINLTVPNAYALVGNAYHGKHLKYELGFTLIYMGMNLGAIIGFISSGFLMRFVNFSAAFSLCSISLVMGAIVFYFYFSAFYSKKEMQCFSKSKVLWGVLFCLLSLLFIRELLQYEFICRLLLLLIAILLLVILFTLAYLKRKEGAVGRRLFLFGFLLILTVVFWAVYALQPTVITLFINRYVHRELFGYFLPTPVILSISPLYTLILGGVISFFWVKSKSHQSSSSSLIVKFSVSLISISLAFFILYLGLTLLPSGKALPLYWMFIAFFFISFGEIILAPTSMMIATTLVNERWRSTAQGIVRLMTGAGLAISGSLAHVAALPHVDIFSVSLTGRAIYKQSFLLYGQIPLVFGVFSFTAYKVYLSLVKLTR